VPGWPVHHYPVNGTSQQSAKKSFDRVRRSRELLIGYEQSGITLITFEVIEPVKVTAGAVHEKTEHLEKVSCDRDALFIFSDRTGLTFDDWHELNTFQIPPANKANPVRLVIRSSVDSIALIFCLFLH
jgi:hypothetical protein